MIYCYSEGMFTYMLLRHDLALYDAANAGLHASNDASWARTFSVSGTFGNKGRCVDRLPTIGTLQDPRYEVKYATIGPSGTTVRVNEYPIRNESCESFFARAIQPMLQKECAQQTAKSPTFNMTACIRSRHTNH